MARNITVTFADGTTHVYQNAPANVTPEQVTARAQKEFGKQVTALDGGRNPDAKSTGVQKDFATKVGAEIVSLGDLSLGSIIPGAINTFGYMVARGRGGRSAEQAKKAMDEYSAPFARPFARAAGVENDPTYRDSLANRGAQYVGGKIEQGLEWLGDKTGIAPSDIGAIGGAAASVAAPVVGARVAKVAGPAVNAMTERAGVALQDARGAIQNRMARPAPAVKGGGAMDTPAAVKRQVTAEGLRRPVQLTKGQITRDPAQLRLEEDIRKAHAGDAGKPLVERYAQQNEDILANFDAYLGSTGAEAAGEAQLIPVGKIVDKALVEQAKAAKKEVRDAYDKARAAGEMDEPISYKPLIDYVNEQTPTVREKLAPVIQAVAEQIRKNDPEGTGSVSVNAMEDIRQLINKVTEPGTPNAAYAPELKKLIDGTMEGATGELYRQARATRVRYARQFEDAGAVAKLLDKKGKTQDRAVAFEDVFDHAVRKGSLQDTMNIGRLLKKTPEGQQAWKEIQGQTVQLIRERATRINNKDSAGNNVISPSGLNNIVRELDSDGKLDYIFGKQGAQEIRDLNETVQNAMTTPPGTTNYSNNAAWLIKALEKVESSVIGKIPGVKPTAQYAAQKAREKKLRQQVEEALYPGADDPDATGTPPTIRPPKMRQNRMAPANNNRNAMRREQ